MRTTSIAVLLITLGFATTFCSKGQQKEPAAAPEAEQEKMAYPEPDAAALWQYMTQQNYQTWPMWPGKTAFYEGTEPHGALLTTYVNDIASRALQAGETEMPIYSIIAKENYTPEKELAAVTVMYKVEGYNPEAGDWFWAKYLPDESVEASGKVESCISCHQEGRDYLRTAMAQ